jgi:pyruvate formate lyase activating enzyme
VNRRRFLRDAAAAGLLLGPGLPALRAALDGGGRAPGLSPVEARYYRKLPDREIECLLCPRLCRLGDKERGYCGVRENIGGTYYTLVYGGVCSFNVDPIEKKPFFHFLPGTAALSMATAGCNVNCRFCQNWEISQVRPEQIDHIEMSPEAAAREAAAARCPSIAYTYSEPTVFIEYMMDTAEEARKRKVRNVVVTGGHISRRPLEDLLEVVDAVKVDLKGFTQDFYAKYVRGELGPVLDAIRTVARSRVWLEIVYLVIPTLNDDPALIREMARWVKNEAGDRVPVHFSRFHPMYLLKNLPPTPISTLERSREAALAEGLKFVYVGNVPGHPSENTICPGCGTAVIERSGFTLRGLHLDNGRCASCGQKIDGIWA